MPIDNFMIPALETVLAWDLPDDLSGQALWHQAGLMAGTAPEQGAWEDNV